MNAFESILLARQIKYTALFDITKIENIRFEKFKSSYRWFVEYLGRTYKLNMVKDNSEYPFIFDVFCNKCGVTIHSKERLGRLFKLKKQPEIQLAHYCRQMCKGCAALHNATINPEKRKQTCIKRYGVECNFLLPDFHKTATASKIEKYGENYGKVIAKKSQETYFQNTGYTHTRYCPEAEKKRLENWHKTVNERSAEKQKEVIENRLKSYNKEGSPGLFGSRNSTKSKIATEFYDKLSKSILVKIICEYKEFFPYSVDFYIPNVCIIEFFGDFWHANPSTWKKNDLMKFPGANKIYAKDIWKKDKSRLQSISEQSNLPIFIVWETDYKKNKDQCVLNICQQIKEIIPTSEK